MVAPVAVQQQPQEQNGSGVQVAKVPKGEARPYIGPPLYKVPEDLVVPNAMTIECDERLWVPQAENVWFRPLCFSGP